MNRSGYLISVETNFIIPSITTHVVLQFHINAHMYVEYAAEWYRNTNELHIIIGRSTNNQCIYFNVALMFIHSELL